MIFDVSAVTDTQGTATSLTFQRTKVYTPTTGVEQRIPGALTRGSISPTESFVQQNTNYAVTHISTANSQYLTVGPRVSGSTFNPKYDLIGQSSGAVWTPSGNIQLAPYCFMYFEPLFGLPFILTTAEYSWDGTSLTVLKPMGQITAVSLLTCVPPSFTVPAWAKSLTVSNISGASCYIRRYAPNGSGHVIDTPTLTLLDPNLVGGLILDDQTLGFVNGDTSQGCSYMVAADSEVVNGAIVSFYP